MLITWCLLSCSSLVLSSSTLRVRPARELFSSSCRRRSSSSARCLQRKCNKSFDGKDHTKYTAHTASVKTQLILRDYWTPRVSGPQSCSCNTNVDGMGNTLSLLYLVFFCSLQAGERGHRHRCGMKYHWRKYEMLLWLGFSHACKINYVPLISTHRNTHKRFAPSLHFIILMFYPSFTLPQAVFLNF